MKQSQQKPTGENNQEISNEYLEVLHRGNEQELSHIIADTLHEAETNKLTFASKKQFDHCMEQRTF